MSTKTSNKELAVAALKDGTVIDHIPARTLFQAVKILGLADMSNSITIGYNLDSNKLGKKGIIKVAGVEFAADVLDRIALIAPSAVINIIRDYEVVEKRPVRLPDNVVGIVRCNNPKCITNNEPMKTRFMVIADTPDTDTTLRCHYCNHTVEATKAQML